MPEAETDLLAAVDALIAGGGNLPDPAERRRLREAHELTQADVATALDVTTQQVRRWESGEAAPRPPQRGAYQRLLAKLAELYPTPAAPAGQEDQCAAVGADLLVTSSTCTGVTAGREETRPDGAGGPKSSRPVGRTSTARAKSSPGTSGKTSKASAPVPTSAAPAGQESGQADRFPSGPLVVLDGSGQAYGAGGLVLGCPAKSLSALASWALSQDLGAPRLDPHGEDADPLVVLTPAAAARLGLPAELEDRGALRLPADHKVLKAALKAGWQLTRRGFGPWGRLYKDPEGRRRRCVQFAMVGWGAFDSRAWPGLDGWEAPEIARVLSVFADRLITPAGSTAVTGLRMLTELRPRTRAVRAEDGSWVSGPVPGSLTRAVDPAPPEAPKEHPIAAGRPMGPAFEIDEEAYDWIRDPQTLTDTECEQPFAVGLDVNMAFAAAANGLLVGLGEAEHAQAPAFDPKTPGSWLVDLSGIELDPRLPSPFTPDGRRPEGPAWYATPTLAYALELGLDVRPAEAWVRRESGRYLDPWYKRMRDAYLATLADLGVTTDQTPQEFLAAMEHHKQVDPGMAVVLAAIKAAAKGTVGKMRERAQGAGYVAGQGWPALERPTWRPDIRAAIISAARVNLHRKMRKAAGADLWPLAVLSDCVVYPASGPSPLDVLTYGPDGKPTITGAFRLGPSPGMVKHEGTQSMLWAVELLDAGANPARLIKDPTRDSEE